MRRLPAKIRHLLQWVAVNFFYLVTPILLLIFVLWLHEAEKSQSLDSHQSQSWKGSSMR
jgi:hypothetical protein